VGALHEIVVSPASLVDTPVKDQALQVWGWLKNILPGPDDHWTRHPKPTKPPERFPPKHRRGAPPVKPGAIGPVVFEKKPLEQKGDQVAIVSFLRTGDRAVRVRVTYYPVVEPLAPPEKAKPRSLEFTMI